MPIKKDGWEEQPSSGRELKMIDAPQRLSPPSYATMPSPVSHGDPPKAIIAVMTTPKSFVIRPATSADVVAIHALVRDLASSPMQQGPSSGGGRIVIGWGRHDRLCLARQAKRAMAAFPEAQLHWFEHSGHFPMWDEPAETVALIVETTRGDARAI